LHSDEPRDEALAAVPPGVDATEEDRAAWWLRDRIADEGERLGCPLTRHEADTLMTPINWLGPVPANEAKALNNKVVSLVRSAMEHEERQGATTVMAREGLRIPRGWHRAYSVLYEGNSPLVLAGIMQNAMLENPAAGETSPWQPGEQEGIKPDSSLPDIVLNSLASIEAENDRPFTRDLAAVSRSPQ
jgi:hypothetical protein